jgi:hypothetical protein
MVRFVIPQVAGLVFACDLTFAQIKLSVPHKLNDDLPKMWLTNSVSPETNVLRKSWKKLEINSPPPAPGIYLSEPYTCIIMVPKDTHDDCCIGGMPRFKSKMPVHRPGLKLIPLPPASK